MKHKLELQAFFIGCTIVLAVFGDYHGGAYDCWDAL